MHDHEHGPNCNHDHDHDHGHSHVRREPVRNEGPKVGRNDPCVCGSGKKYKQCCGKAA